MKKMTNQDWQRAYEPLPDMLEARVQHTLAHLEEEQQVKKFTIRTAVLVLALLLALGGVAYAIIHSQTAEYFGENYGEETKQELLAGDIAQLGQSYQLGDVVFTMEDMIYKQGDQAGLYTMLKVAPAQGSNIVLLPNEYGVNDPAGFNLHFGTDVTIPEGAPTYAELAQSAGGKILQPRASIQKISVDGKDCLSEYGISWYPEEDGTVEAGYEIYGDFPRSQNYEVTLQVSTYEVTLDGEWLREEPNNTWVKEEWTFTVTPEMADDNYLTAEERAALPDEAVPEATPIPEGTFTVFDYWGREEYLEKYPDRTIKLLETIYDEDGNSNEQELLMSGEWDVAYFFMTERQLTELVKSVPLLDLGTEAYTAEQIGKMYEALQAAVTIDGQMVAMPLWVDGAVEPITLADMVRRIWLDGEAPADDEYIDIRAQLGFTDADEPATFTQLAVLAEKYMALPRETRKGTIFGRIVNDLASIDTKRYYLDYLTELYVQETYISGQPMDFDTPVFREGLDAIDRIYNAFLSDPKKTYGDSKVLYSVIDVGGGGFMQMDANYLHVIDTDKIPARVGVAVINANTTHKAEALDYIEALAQNFMSQFGAAIYDDFDYDAVLRQAYDDDIQSQIDQNEAQSVIDDLIRRRDAGEPISHFDRESIAYYRENVAPHIAPSLSSVYVTGVDEIKKAYAEGKTTKDELIEGLNTIYQAAIK